jgi:SAM-dependent methyltransferase
MRLSDKFIFSVLSELIMAQDMRKLVREGYNEGSYEKVYKREDKKLDPFDKLMCDELISRLPKNSKILDLGCGTGLPYDKYFIDNNMDLTGIDISEKHINLAKKNVKNTKYLVGDFFSEDIKGKFDAIISFFAIFHIPRTEHKKLLKRINSLLQKRGYILITLGAEDMKCDVNSDFVGAPMAWSSYSVEKNKQLIRDAGFEIIMASEDYRTEKHLWIFAKKQ